MSLSILNVDSNNIDIGMIDNITQKGFEYFLSCYPSIIKQNQSNIEYTYFKSYLDIYFFEDCERSKLRRSTDGYKSR